MEREGHDFIEGEVLPVHHEWAGQSAPNAGIDISGELGSLAPISMRLSEHEFAKHLVADLTQHGFAIISEVDDFALTPSEKAYLAGQSLFSLPPHVKQGLQQQLRPQPEIVYSPPVPLAAPLLVRQEHLQMPAAYPMGPYPQGPPVFDMSHVTKTSSGYSPMQSEQLNPYMPPDLKESFDYGLPLDSTGRTLVGTNVFPPLNSVTKEFWDDYLKNGVQVSKKLIHAIALGLGLPPTSFDDVFENPLAIQRFLRYPAQRNFYHPGGPGNPSDSAIGAGSHIDYGGLTLLCQNSEGLQIQKRDGSWLEISTKPGEIIVNVGFMLEKLTNGALVATQHRVINNNAIDRYSTALFYDPNPTRKIIPAKHLKSTTTKNYEECIAGHKGVKYNATGYKRG
jgi:isopenicillin N synthase-like dioxygenase